MRACASTSSAVMAISTPMRRIFSDCCATAASGQVAVEPAITFMKSRRLIASPEAQDKASCGIKVAHWKVSDVEVSQCPLWVKSGHMQHVHFTPESGHLQCTTACLLWAKSGH